MADGPCTSYAQIVTRWGTFSPTLSQVTTIPFMTSHTTDADPVIAKSTLKAGAYLEFTTVPTTVLSGTIASATAVNRSAGTLWQATFTGLGAACNGGVGCLLVDTTSGGNAWLLDAPAHSGDSYSLSTPLSPATVTAIGHPLGSVAAEKTVSAGDAFNILKFPTVNLVDLEPTTSTSNGGGAGVVAYRVNVLNPESSVSALGLGGNVMLSESFSSRMIESASSGGGWAENLSTDYAFTHELYNTSSEAAFWAQGQKGFPIIWGDAGGTFLVVGGSINANGNGLRLNNANIQQDTVLTGAGSGGIVSENLLIGGAYVGASNGLYCFGPCSIDYDNTHSTGNNVWGPGELLAAFGGFVRYRSDTPAVSTFLTLGGISVNPSGLGCSISPIDAGVPVIACNIALTPTNLDLAIGSGGFGGFAFGPGQNSGWDWIGKSTP